MEVLLLLWPSCSSVLSLGLSWNGNLLKDQWNDFNVSMNITSFNTKSSSGKFKV